MRHLVAALILCVGCPCWAGAEIPTPAETFGHEVGADHKLIPYPEVLSYLESVAAASDRVSIEEAGRSTLDNPLMVVILTSPENQANLETYIFDFDGDLYGAHLSVALVVFLRPEMNFASLDALTARMAADCAQARDVLAAL